MAIVVDVSIAAAWCFPDEQADAAERALDELPRLGGVVPGIFRYEIRNVLVVNEAPRSHRSSGQCTIHDALAGFTPATGRCS